MAEQDPQREHPETTDDVESATPDGAAQAASEETPPAPQADGVAAEPGGAPQEPDAAPDASDAGKGDAPGDSAEDMAAQALADAQHAIANLGSGEDEPGLDDAGPSTESAELPGRHIGATPPRQVRSVESVELPTLGGTAVGDEPEGIDLLSDVDLHVKIELGRTVMLVEDVLRLNNGSIVELDKLAGDPVDVYVNDRHVARGEVLVLNDTFCVRISEVLVPVSTASGP
ncbi:MAG: flagellar motor switch protein FliN [Phycisphaerales bacterium]|nr:flagellar motor switch protein FliN [Phycisphaerales bacterium]